MHMYKFSSSHNRNSIYIQFVCLPSLYTTAATATATTIAASEAGSLGAGPSFEVGLLPTPVAVDVHYIVDNVRRAQESISQHGRGIASWGDAEYASRLPILEVQRIAVGVRGLAQEQLAHVHGDLSSAE